MVLLEGRCRHSRKSVQLITRLECSRRPLTISSDKLVESFCRSHTWRKLSRFPLRSLSRTLSLIFASILNPLNVSESHQLPPSYQGILLLKHTLRVALYCDHRCTSSTFRCDHLQQGSIIELDSLLPQTRSRDLCFRQQCNQLLQRGVPVDDFQRNLPKLVQDVCSGRTKARKTW